MPDTISKIERLLIKDNDCIKCCLLCQASNVPACNRNDESVKTDLSAQQQILYHDKTAEIHET